MRGCRDDSERRNRDPPARHDAPPRPAAPAVPPDANYVEPGGSPYTSAGGFSAVATGQAVSALGSAEQYARLKAANFPAEGGPVILEVEVPGWIVDILRNDPVAAMIVASGEVRFEPDLGLTELQQAWPTLTKRIVPV